MYLTVVFSFLFHIKFRLFILV